MPYPSADITCGTINGFWIYARNGYFVLNGKFPAEHARFIYREFSKVLGIRADGHGGNIDPEDHFTSEEWEVAADRRYKEWSVLNDLDKEFKKNRQATHGDCGWNIVGEYLGEVHSPVEKSTKTKKTPETIIGPDKWEYVPLTEWENQNAQIKSLTDQVKTLTSDVEQWKRCYKQIENTLEVVAIPQIDLKRTTIVECLKALEPFAKFVEELKKMGRGTPKSGVFYGLNVTLDGDGVELLVEDFNQALNLLTTHALYLKQ